MQHASAFDKVLMMSNQRPDWKAGIYREFVYQLEQGYARAADTRLFLTQAPLERSAAAVEGPEASG